jgi:hypothetical protein
MKESNMTNTTIYNNFYVYAYLRKDGTPYYIGKGTAKRAYVSHGRIKRPADRTRIVLLQENMIESDAFALEIQLIELYGRKDIGTGILHNLTNGGEGPSGRMISEETRTKLRGMIITEEHRAKLSASLAGRSLSEEHRKKIGDGNRGKTCKPFSEEHRAKLKASRVARQPISEETRMKMRNAHLGNAYACKYK